MKDIFSWQEDSYSIEVTANAVSSSRARRLNKKIARIFKDNKYSAQVAIGDHAAQKLWQQCDENFAFALPINYAVPQITSKSFESNGQVDHKVFEAQVNELLKKFTREFPQFIAQGKFSLERKTRTYEQDSGEKLISTSALTNAYLCLKYRSSANIIDHVIDLAGDAQANLEDITNGQEDFLRHWDKEVSISPGKKNVCFVSDTSDLFMKLTQALRPEVYHSGASILSNKAGEKVFHQDFSLSDLSIDAGNGIYRPFDDEGTLRNSNAHSIVKAGVFTGPLYDLRTAKKYGKLPTGNAQRYPIPRGAIDVAPNFYDLHAGAKTLQEHFNDLDEVVVILMAGGGDTTADGEFSTPAQVAFLVKNGEVAGRLPQITLRGNIREYLGSDFIGIAKDRSCSGRQRPLLTRLNLYLN